MERVVLRAPLAPNVNHQNTVFGGSAASLATLAAWALLHIKLAKQEFQSVLVVQRSSISYDKAIASDFTAVATSPPDEVWRPFENMLQRKGRGRIAASAILMYGEQIAGRLEGEFVATKSASEAR